MPLLSDPAAYEGDPAFWEQAALKMSGEAVAVLFERHYKYGPGNIAANGVPGIIMRIEDKIARLKNAMSIAMRNPDWDGKLATVVLADGFDDETIVDAWNDISNFGLIGRMWDAGLWELPVEADAAKVASARQQRQIKQRRDRPMPDSPGGPVSNA